MKKVARQGGLFCLGHVLLGSFSPPFDKLLQCLAAVPQALAFLKVVNKGDGLLLQIGDELMPALGDKAPAIGAESSAQGIGAWLHVASAGLVLATDITAQILWLSIEVVAMSGTEARNALDLLDRLARGKFIFRVEFQVSDRTQFANRQDLSMISAS